MKKTEGNKVDTEWKLIMKNHPTFARVLLAQQAILIEASQIGDKSVDYNMTEILNSGLPVIFANYWAERSTQDFGNLQISAQLSCILDSGDGNPAACFNMNPEDSWLDVPSQFKTKAPLRVFPVQAVETKTVKAVEKKTAKAPEKTVKKAAPKRQVVRKSKNIILPYHEG